MAGVPRRRVRQRPDPDEEDETNVVVPDSQEANGTPSTPTSKRRRVDVQQYKDYTTSVRYYDLNYCSEHVEGAIVSVRLQNFITYDDCSFEPGPRLNVVIGPNGSGKSSIVCAFALGLAGATSLLGRAKDPSEYIKYGAEKATIIIELKGAPGSRNVFIRRDIKKDNTSEWRINGKVVNKTDVITKTKSMNVQVDNLCQFLPQDKVSSFAAMDPAQLLVETEKAVGTEKMHEYHEQLIGLRKKEKELERTCEEHGNIAQDLKKKNELLERDVLRFQERQKLLQKVEILEKKKPWLLFEEQRQIALELKDQRSLMQNEYKEAEKTKQPLVQRIREAEAECRSVETSRASATNNFKKFEKESETKRNELENLERQADMFIGEFENLKNRTQNREKEVQTITREIGAIKEEIKTLPTANQVKAVMDEKNAELKELNKELGQLQMERITVQDKIKSTQAEVNRFQTKLKEADDVRLQAIENLRRYSNETYQAFQWVQQNQSKFKQKVYGPVCLEMNVPEPLYAQYLEMTIPMWLLTNAQDRDFLLAELVDKQKLPVSATYLPDSVQRERRSDSSALRHLGIAGYLEDLFTTSVPYIKEVIVANAPVDTAGAGNNESIKHVDGLLKSDLSLFFTPESRYSKVRSRYGDRQTSTSVAPVKSAKLLSGVNVENVREAKARIEEKKRDLDILQEVLSKHEQEEQQINLRINNSRKERDNMNNEKKKADTVIKKLEMKEKQLAQMQKEEDTEKEEETLRAKMKGVNVTRARQAVLLMKILKQLVQSQMTLDEANLTRFEAQAALSKAQDELKAVEATFVNLKRELDEVCKRFDRARDLARKLKDEAERKAPITEELKDQIAELPNNIEELEAMITEHTRKIELLYATNPAVVQQYEARMREIEDISTKLEDEKTMLADLKVEIAEIKDKWLPPLEALVGRINETFSRFFAEIGCVGEVGLDKHEDYDKYGIMIKVKFRNEEKLEALNSHLQSGGERSVSTMLYLISLQDITPCPFRVVDEINQGMDPYNERMIFRQVVQSAGRPGLPQYFLITPKLLPDLDYTPNMTILCVYNGPWQFTQEEWDRRIKRLFS